MKKDRQGSTSLSREDIRQVWTDLRERVRDAYPIERAIRENSQVNLLGRGDIREACCPFHMERTPSFNVILSKGRYRCFGAGCGAEGDMFSFLQAVHGVSFRDAVLMAADRAGVPVPDICRGTSAKKARHTAAIPPARTIRYPESSVRTVPENLRAPALVPVPAGVALPSPNRWFELWDDAERSRDPTPRLRKFHPKMVHLYRDIDGQPLCAVLRIEHETRGKFFIPARLGQPKQACPPAARLRHRDVPEGMAWMVLGTDPGELKPVYGMERARAWASLPERHLLLVEGEKTCDAATRLAAGFEGGADWLVLSPMGGGNASIYAHWQPLMQILAADPRPVRVHLWPDADAKLIRPDGTEVDRQDVWTRQTLSALLQSAIDAGLDPSLFGLSRVVPPKDVESGWDLADAEKEGWTAGDVAAELRNSSRTVDIAMLELRKPQADLPTAEAAAEEAVHAPFDPAAPEEPSGDTFDADWAEFLEDYRGDAADPHEDPQVLADLGLLGDPEAGAAAPGFEVQTVAPDDAVAPEDVDGGDDGTQRHDPVLENRYFRCLGYLNNINYFMSLESGQIFALNPANMRANYFLQLAPKHWWLEWFPGTRDKHGNATGVNWEDATGALIQGVYRAGVWDPEREVGQGARIDGGRTVFNMGNKLYVEGLGIVPTNEFSGHYHYTVGKACRTPDFTTPFEEGAPEIRQMLDIISKLNWREAERQLSILALFGWIGISPICGILKWRPHIWLDGPRGAGKSWIINNILAPALGDYCCLVKGNSTESGLRNMLHGKAFPLIFDEAEGEEKSQRTRLEDILKLARHSATEGQSVVAQGVPGGGGEKHYSIQSTFMLCSITPQLEAAADHTRFARAHLSAGRNLKLFSEQIEGPAAKLLTPEFSNRMIGRLVLQSRHYFDIYMNMVHALTFIGLERRLADVFGALGTGAWLLLRDGAPADREEAAAFLAEEFDIISHIVAYNEEIVEDKDHNRIYRLIMTHALRFDSRNMGARTERVGSLIEVACGICHDDGDDCVIGIEEARAILKDLGIRPGLRGKICGADEEADCLLIHKNAAPLKGILEKTPYANGYADVMQHGEGVKVGDPVRFSAALGNSRPIVVPLSYFFGEVRKG
ncbi:hypothetical protein LAZ40_11550 [Cereibacter sphaeroides]|uniref:CHC2 zinc finger domain-containing protein n=1 Tax=Cereibacter sphaeroides TaxID=1063 RepID=UPI001F43FE51|nr:CHC2 zinc finger domain-containing protein [Cereibacter sphaeroides]MCE6959653.1 hypothetical protein [Cereibacter sphaeroides]MCE6974486.1 hypothetical protein [Cereibacter sphaeroides]